MTLSTHTRLFDTYAEAAAAVRDLETAGFSQREVSLLGSKRGDGPGQGDPGLFNAGGNPEAGAAAGTLVGGSVGLLAGLGALAIPGVGPVVAAGWLVAMLTGAGAGAVAGGLLGSLADAGVQESDAQVYAEGMRRGGTIVIVRSDPASVARAEAILAHHQPVHLATREAAYRAKGWSGYRSDDAAVLSAPPEGSPGNPPGINVTGARPQDDPRRV